MKNLLIINLLDYREAPNGRIHHLISHLRKKFEEVVVLYGSNSVPGTTLEKMKKVFLCQVAVSEEGNLKRVQVDSFLNYTDGLAKRMTGYPGTLKEGEGLNVRLLIEKILSPLGIVKEVCVTLSYLLMFFLKVRKKFDVCLVQCPLTGLVGYILKKLNRVKIVVYDDIDYAPGWMAHRLRRNWVSFWENYCLKRADLVISCGDLLAELRRKETKREVFVVPNGLNYQMFAQPEARGEHPPTLVYAGSIIDWAGLETVLLAVREVKEKIPHLRFHIVGSGEPSYENKLKNLAAKLKIENEVLFKGKVRYEDLPQHLREGDVGIACLRPTPLTHYAFPLKVVEYMAGGLPVIGTRGMETEKIITHYDCGIAVDFDPHQIGKAIYSLLKEEDLRSRYSSNGRRYSAEFDWNNLMEKELRYIRDAYETANDRETIQKGFKKKIVGAGELVLRLGVSLSWLVVSLPFFTKRTKTLPELTSTSSILVIQRDHLGDLLFTTPALRLLRQKFPSSPISVLTRTFGEEVLSGNPNVDEQIGSNALLDRRNSFKDIRQFFQLASLLRRKKFDIVFNFSKGKAVAHAFLAYLTGARYRVGLKTKERVGFLGRDSFAPFHNFEVRLSPDQHIVDYFLQAVAMLGNSPEGRGKDEGLEEKRAVDKKMEFYVFEEDKEFIQDFLKKRALTENDILVAIHAGAGRKDKRLSRGKIVKLAEMLIDRYGAKVIFTGIPSELSYIEGIVKEIKAGQPLVVVDLSLKQLAALLAQCDLFVSPDTGPLHLAEIMTTPTISFFGPDNYLHSGPIGEKHIVLKSPVSCSPCYSFVHHWPRPFERCAVRCVNMIPREDIEKAVERQLIRIVSENE